MAIVYPKNLYECSSNEKVLFQLLKDKTSMEHHMWFQKGSLYEPAQYLVLTPDLRLYQFMLFDWKMRDFDELALDDMHLRFHGEGLPVDAAFDLTSEKYDEHETIARKHLMINPYFKHLNDQLKCYRIFVFPNIMESDFHNLTIDKKTVASVFEGQRYILKEDIDRFLKLDDVLDYVNETWKIPGNTISTYELAEKDYIRYCIDPIIRLDSLTSDFHLLLDSEQAQIIHMESATDVLVTGGSGTGKTSLLVKRVVRLTQEDPKCRILVAGYHEASTAKLREKLLGQLTDYGVVRILDAEDLKEEFHNKSYDYVLVDEAQDFTPDHYHKFMKLIKDDGHIWLFANGAQNVYENDYDYKNIGFSLHEAIYLDKNYRSTKEIITLADAFLFGNQNALDKAVENLTHTHYARRIKRVHNSGELPKIHVMTNLTEEIEFVVQMLQKQFESGENYSDTAVVVMTEEAKEKLLTTLKKWKIPYETEYKKNKEVVLGDAVRVGKAHEMKGFEFKHVILINSARNEDALTKRLLYLVMMRATERLTLFFESQSAYSQALKEVYDQRLESGEFGIAVESPAYVRILIHELKVAKQARKAIEREKLKLTEKQREIDAAKEELTNREMRAIVAAGPKDIEVLNKKIETKDAKINQLKKEVESLSKTLRKEKARNWKSLFESLYYERERFAGILKILLIIAVVLAGVYYIPRMNEHFNIQERFNTFLENLNQQLEGERTASPDEAVTQELSLEVIGDDESQSSYYTFEFSNVEDSAILADGFYMDGFRMTFSKQQGVIQVSLMGTYMETEDSTPVEIDKVVDLSSDSIRIKVNNAATHKYTQEGVIPIEFLWPQDEDGNYYEDFE